MMLADPGVNYTSATWWAMCSVFIIATLCLIPLVCPHPPDRVLRSDALPGANVP